MKEITVFVMEGCPYCRNAEKAAAELQAENENYKDIKINWVDENKQSDIARNYDYYYVPTFFYGQEKLYEARPGDTYRVILENVRNAFDTVNRA